MGLHSRNGNGGAFILPPTPQVITGRSLAHKQLDARQRACLAANVLDGLAKLDPSQAQLAVMFGVSIPYITVARRLSPSQRIAIVRGWDQVSFTELLHPPRQMSLWGPAIPSLRVLTTAEVTDSQLAAVIRAAGIERTLNVAAAVDHA
jgi:hypothetical protein